VAEGDDFSDDGEEQEKRKADDDCPVCLLPLEESRSALQTLVCGHTFHSSCADLWVKKCERRGWRPTCPLCRAELAR